MFGNVKRPDDATIELIKRSGDNDRTIAIPAQRELALAIQAPLREGLLVGDIVGGWFQAILKEPGATIEFPLDLLAPGEEDEHVAYTAPPNGYIAQRQVEGDYVMVPTYRMVNAIDWLLRYAREGGWDVVGRAIQVFEAGFRKKINDDAWHVLLTAAADRNILIYDADASAGQFTKRLVSLLKTVVRRNGGGNSGTLNRRKLTDIAVSPEALEDMRNWGLDQVDEMTRRDIYLASDNSDKISRVFGVNLHDLDELGVGQEYQLFFTSVLGASLQASDEELVIGADLNQGSFVQFIKEQMSVFDDPALHRHQKGGVYGWFEQGLLAADNRDIIAGSF